MGSKHAHYVCPECGKGSVAIKRKNNTAPWVARCHDCGKTWEYVQSQQYQGIRTTMGSDGTMGVVFVPILHGQEVGV